MVHLQQQHHMAEIVEGQIGLFILAATVLAFQCIPMGHVTA